MNNDSSINLSFILNETSINDIEKEAKSNSRGFFYSVLIIILIYFSAIYLNEIKSFSQNILNKYTILDKEEKNLNVSQSKLETTKNKIVENIMKKNEEKVLKNNVIIDKNKILPTKSKKENFIEMFKSNVFKVFQCDNYKINKYQLDNICKLKLEKFLNANKDAIKFEVVAMLGENDIKYYSKYKNYLEEVLMIGISAKRVQEMILEMKMNLTEGIFIPDSHYIKSDENTSSVMIKAYYSKLK